MHRRPLLATTALLAAGLFAGCLDATGTPGDDDSDEGTDSTDDDTDGSDDDTANDGGADGSDSDGGAETPQLSDAVVDADFSAAGECDAHGEATITFDEANSLLTVSGCLAGHNGCAEPIFVSATEADDADNADDSNSTDDTDDIDDFRVVIGEADLSEPGTACTEAIVNLAYELRLTFEADLPRSVEVVHDDAYGRETAATADR